ncbi:LPXTG cell wall anchor domain-containing protein [Streptococcus suis]|uniref:Spy0128 family protein n=1 Tax=Streptococcus suis TaxID=1307 RepID=UPI001DEDD3D5|nr:FctA domain-containing protein [Streptococcus suis]MBS7862630.1 LPXTG cell wall anchor domain-containing protein [Streptococcus suis]MBS7884471.1 LPXTG cell wall anchor domain-containing protein [Streptococcus suis]MBS7910578.1 LPXTG cell wall anchor domain-containing protein [Streptococcus suis]MBS7971760.1 LPXTG cell wall anchor domain-containing protein [Streptococcus suis]MCJ7460862.1 LPXTG cell wall anchor domain-containing protein [Streptococcus suis]
MNTKKWRTSLLIPGIVLFGTVALVNNVSAQEVKNTIISAKQPDGGQATSKAVNVKIPAVVRLFGRELLENEFKFELREANGEELPVLDTAQNTKEGQVRFKNLSFDKPGKYWYTISEVKDELGGIEYDSKYIVAKITVEDRNGQLQAMIEFIDNDNVFNNFYTPAPAAASLSIKKVLEGRTLNTGEFEFVLKNEKGDEIEKVSNQADGSVNFSALTFTKEGTYTYTVSEVDGGLGDIIYDKSDIKATVTVKDNNHGQLVSTVTYENSDQIFENILNPGKLIAPTTDSVITDNEVSKEAMTGKEKGNIEPPKEQIANEEKDNIEASEKQMPSIVNDMVVTPQEQMANKENDKVVISEKQMPSIVNDMVVTPQEQMANKENDKVETSEKQMPVNEKDNAVTPEKQMANKEKENIETSKKQIPVNENNQNGTVEENSNTKPTTEKTDKQETSTFKTETAKQILPVTGEKGSLWLLTSGIIGLAIALFTRKRKL